MAIHRLQIDDFVTIDYELIAIHSSLEDYRLAYFINRELHILLEKSPKDIGLRVKEGESFFSRYIFEDAESGIAYSLIRNRNTITSTQNLPASLFGDEGYSLTTSVHLLPELKKVDYILKIENVPSGFTPARVTEKLLGISYVTTTYTLDRNKLRSKNNLIF